MRSDPLSVSMLKFPFFSHLWVIVVVLNDLGQGREFLECLITLSVYVIGVIVMLYH